MDDAAVCAWSSASQRSAPISPISRSLSVPSRVRRGQRVAVDQLGDEQRVAVFLADLVQGHDPRVVEPGGGLRLAHRSPLLGAAGVDRLDRDRPLEPSVPGLVDDAEATAADPALDQEAVEDQGADHSTPTFAGKGRILLPHALCCGSWRYDRASVDTLRPVNLLGRAVSWRTRLYPGRDADRGRAAVPNASRSCCGAGLRLPPGLLVLILIVLGIRGCLNARKHRALSDYASNVTQIVEETEQTSEQFFGKLSDPGSLSVTEFVGEVNADRSAMDSYTSRVDGLDAPGDMGNAQNTLELVYALRSHAMGEIADKMSTALGDVGAEKATEGDRQADADPARGDVLYAEVARPEINGGARRQRDRRRRRAEKRIPPRRDRMARRKQSAPRSERSAARPAPKRRASTGSA